MRTVEDQVKATKRLLKRQDERKRKLENAGIKYDFSAVEYVGLFALSESNASRPLRNLLLWLLHDPINR